MRPAPPPAPSRAASREPAAKAPSTPRAESPEPNAPATDLKSTILTAIRKQKPLLYGTSIAQAQRIEADGGTISFTFNPGQKLLRSQLEQQRAAVEAIATEAAGRPIAIRTIETAAAAGEAAAPSAEDRRKAELKKTALEQPGVQSLIDVFGADIQEVEEIDR
ncbi:MAG TPA: hypothetical protein VFZ36_12605 [Vicinamibacterales bacterium]